MATLTSHLPLSALRRSAARRDRRHSLLLASALTPLAILIHGYHPYAEDGGIYLAAVKRLLHPQLYPTLTGFVLAPSRFSLFAPFVAALARLTHLTTSERLPFLLFALHLATVWSTLYAASALASRCWPSIRARAGTALLIACWLGMPVAGTSLLFMDPYLTARSFSTPCAIIALVAALDATARDLTGQRMGRRAGPILVWSASLVFASLIHPLMAIYALFATLLLAACRLPPQSYRLFALLTLVGLSVALAGAVTLLAPPEEPGYLQVAVTRTYWFLARWHWYELIGIAAPLLLLWYFVLRRPAAQPGPGSADDDVTAARALASAAIVCAIDVAVVAFLFCRVNAPTHLLAALQPMRGLQFAYLTLFLVLGGWAGEKLLRARLLAWLIAIPLLGGPLYEASRSAAPASRHLELPGLAPGSPWVQAFLWARDHTPTNALFALPANYISLPGEDAQGFRAIAERSALPDYSKDGGEAAVAPFLTPGWIQAQEALASVDSDSDKARGAKLVSLGVSWFVVPSEVKTNYVCPFRNRGVKVCRLP